MKKLVVLGLVAGLVAGSLAAPAGAAKKKKKPKPPAAPVSVDQKFFLRQDSDACGSSHEHLSLTDGADLSCFYVDSGAPTTAVSQAQAASVDFAAEDGVPFVFDTAKKLTGEITVRGGDIGAGPMSAGQAMVDIVVVGEVGGEVKEIGTVSETWTTVPGDVHLIKVDLEIDPALAGQSVTAFELQVTLGGASVGPHTIELDNPASFVTVPTLATP